MLEVLGDLLFYCLFVARSDLGLLVGRREDG